MTVASNALPPPAVRPYVRALAAAANAAAPFNSIGVVVGNRDGREGVGAGMTG